ncbi:MAG TPA: SigE family RNA polymerase sigma factor [Acidimicrobiia bacterium]|nr:putative polymerase subfamily sigma factor [Acidimicrobiia bacterium]HYJ25214.1 SigE family RNA polymerase sigma factor [Acidimicrobiia bacterium]
MSSTEIGALDIEPFESFYRREYARMVAIARALMRTGSSAEDLAQESFVAAHRNWDRVSGYDDPGAWVRRVLINRATSLHRKAGAELRALTRLGGHAEDTIPELTPRSIEVWDEVRKLPRRQAQATVLHYVDQLSIEEIGEVMGVSPGAVKAHLHKARAYLSKRLVAWAEETI